MVSPRNLFLTACLVFPAFFAPLSARGAGILPPSPGEQGRAFLKARAYRLALERFLLVREKSESSAERAQALFLIGETQFREKDYTAAYQAYQQSLKLSPLSPNTLRVAFKSAVSLAYLKNYRAALSSFQELEKKSFDPDSTSDLRFWEAECRFQMEQYAEARELYEKILEENPQYVHAHLVRYLASWCAYQAKDYPAALEGFEDVSRQAKDKELQKLASLQVAESQFRLGRYADSEKTYREFLDRNPGDFLEASALYGWGWALEKEGKHGEAAQTFQKVVAKHAGHALAPWATVRRGVNALAAGNEDEAREAYRKCFELAPDRSPSDLAQFGLAWIDYSKKSYEVAGQEFAEVARFNPGGDLRWDADYLQAGCFYLTGGYEEAKSHYQSLAEKAPGEIAKDALYWLGWCDYNLSKYSQALEEFQLLAGKAEGELKARALWAGGESAYRSGRYSQAARLYRDALETGPTPALGANCASGLGWSLFQTQDYEAALASFQKAAGAAPGTALAQEARLRAGDCLYNLHRYAEAQKEYQKAAKGGGDPSAALDAQEQIGWCAYREGNFERAVSLWAQLLDKPEAAERKPRLLYWSAWAEFRGKRFEAAGDDFQEVEKLFPQDPLAPESRLRRADCFFNLQRFKDSKDAYQSFLDDYPDHALVPDALYGLQWSAEKLGEKETAAAAARQFLGKFPESRFAPDIRFRLADSLYHNEKYAEAAREYKTLLEKNPDSAEAPRALFWMGTALVKTDREKEAAEAFQQLLRKYPQDPLALEGRFSLGSVYFGTKDFSLALDNYVQIFRNFPDHRLAPHALFNSAVCEKQLKHPNKALEYFGKLMADYPKDPLAEESGLQVGLLQEKYGKTEEALTAYEGVMRSKNVKLAMEAAFYHASLREENKDYEMAIEEFTRFTANYPSHEEWVVTAMGKIAECQEELGQYSKAADTYKKILKTTKVKAFRTATQKRLKALQPFLTQGKAKKKAGEKIQEKGPEPTPEVSPEPSPTEAVP